MEPIKITPKKLEALVEELIKGTDNARGTFLYKGFRIQISKYRGTIFYV